MSEVPQDQYRDRETMDRVKSIAAEIFARHGVDFATAIRAGGWTNATWLAGGLALRMSVQQGNEKILREAKLAALLPAEVGYPPIVETGATDGYEWSLSREIRGCNLGEALPELDVEQRITALRGLWQKIQAIQRVDLAAAQSLARKQSWFNATDAGMADAGLGRLLQQEIITCRQAEVLGDALRRFWQALPTAARVLSHGDMTLENAFWNEGQVVSLMDFEYANISPAELDLNHLVKCAFASKDILQGLQDPDGAGLQRIRQVVADLALPVLAHPGGPDLLLGYAILLELWMLEDWLAHPEGEEGTFEQWQPYLNLVSLADGNGGYLAPILARMEAAER